MTVACVSVFLGILYLYSPALNGKFVFDDLSLPFLKLGRDGPLWGYIHGVRPVLMFSYWLNYQLWGPAPFSYHFVNLVIHFVNTGLVFLVLRRLLAKAGWPQLRTIIASIIGTLVFAIHPLQTEAVSYVAGRSESLMALFLLLAYAAFLYRRHESISWRESLLVLILFGLAVKTKENAVSLAGVLILTDLFWPEPFSRRGLKRNWRLYCLMAPSALVAIIAVFRMLASAPSAGFSAVTFRWYQYGFTEARALLTYIRMALLPLGQSVDQDYPASHTITEHGAIYCLAVLVLLAAVAIVWRRRYPLFCFGLLMFLIWLAPTSSVIPIDDPLVERRMYLPLLGLILIGCEAAGRLRFSRTSAAWTLAIVALLFGKLCHDRNRLWGDPDKLLELAASGAVYNPRPLLNFTEVLIQQNRCDLAPAYLDRAQRRLGGDNYYMNVAWGRTLACLGDFDRAIARLQRAAQLQPCSRVYEWMGLVYGQMGRLEDAGAALQKAVRVDPNSETAHGSLALWYEKTNDLGAADREYRAAVSLDRSDSWAEIGLMRVHEMESGRPVSYDGR